MTPRKNFFLTSDLRRTDNHWWPNWQHHCKQKCISWKI